MGRKKSPTSQMDAGQKARTPLAQRLFDVITDPVALAGKLGVSPQAVSQYRNGGAQPTLERLCQIADIYGVSVDYLLGRVKDPNPSQDFQGTLSLTGLSGPALQRILDARTDDLNLNGELLDGLNILLTSSSLRDLLFSLHMVQQSFAVDKDMEANRAAAKARIKNGLLQGYLDYGKASKAADDAALFEFQAQKALFQVFSEIEGSANSGQY